MLGFFSLLKTKTFWSGVGLIAYGIVRLVSGDPTGWESVITGLGVIFLRDAIRKV